MVAAGGDRGGSVGELIEFEQPGLVGVEQPGAFAFMALEGGVESFELSEDEFVLVGWRAGDHGVLGGDQLSWVEQRLAYLREDVFVELVGADVALRAATHACAGAQGVVAAAVVVAVPGAVAAAHAVTVAAQLTVTAFDQAA